MKVKNWLLSVLPLILISLYPCLFQYSTNLPESRFQDAMIFFGIFLAIALVAFLVLLAIFRRPGPAGFLGSLCMLILINFGIVKSGVQNVFPSFPGLVLLGLFGIPVLAIGLLLLKKKYQCLIPCVLLTVMFGVLCFSSTALAVPQLLSNDHRDNPRMEEGKPGGKDRVGHPEGQQDGKLPNVYFYLYDEYCGPESLQYYYDYDNSGFYAELAARGFACSMSSYNMESCATVQLVPDLYNLSYAQPPFNSGDGESPRIYQLFKDMGYQVNLISHNDFLDTDGARPLTENQVEDSICIILYQNSLLPNTPLSGLIERLPQLQAAYQYTALVEEVLEAMDTAWKYTKNTPTLTLGYIQMPHTWFIYDKDGNPVPEEEHLNWGDPQYYLGQLEYTNKRILGAVDNILEHDPDAIIILMSDHGARLGYHLAELYDAPYDYETDTIHQQNILNCIRVKDQALDIEGLNGVNTLRLMMSEVFGLDFPQYPDPEPKLNPYP